MPNDIEGRREESERAVKYAMEDEIQAEELAIKRDAQKQKEQRRRQLDRKKEAETRKKAEKVAMAEQAKKQARKKEQQENRAIMEEQRQAKRNAAANKQNNSKMTKTVRERNARKETDGIINNIRERSTKADDAKKFNVPDIKYTKQPIRKIGNNTQTNSKNSKYSASDIASAMRMGMALPTSKTNLDNTQNKITNELQKDLQNKQEQLNVNRNSLDLNNNNRILKDSWAQKSLGDNQSNNDKHLENRGEENNSKIDNTRIPELGLGYDRQQNLGQPYNNQYVNPKKNSIPIHGTSKIDNHTNNNERINRNLKNTRDIQQSNDNGENVGNDVGNRGTNIPRKAGKAAAIGKKMAKSLMKRAMLPIIFWFSVAVIIIFLLIGTAGFVMNMPGAVIDRLDKIGTDLWTSVKGIFIGQDEANISDQDIINLATYLEKMAFNLEYYGLATNVKRDEKTNKITQVDSKYLLAYLAAEERNYMIANQNWNVKQWWKNLWNYDKWKDDTIVWGTGMINLHEELLKSPILSNQIKVPSYESGFVTQETVEQILQKIQIHRQTNEMLISRYSLNALNYDTGGYDVYRYKLDYWVEKYGSPVEFYLSLHMATRAPEFAYKIATEYDTKVNVSIHEIQDVEVDIVYVEGSENGKIQLDEEGKPKMIDIKEISSSKLKELKQKWGLSDEVINKMKSFNRQNLITFTPYITSVKNHWYYKEVIYQGTPSEGAHQGKNINVYEERELNPGDPGYVRFYAYTDMQRKLVNSGIGNSSEVSTGDDRKDIEEDTTSASKKPKGFGGLFGKMLSAIVSGFFTGDFSGITGILSTATEAMINEGLGMLKDEMIDLVPDGILKDMATNMLNGLESFATNSIEGIYNGNVTLSDLNFSQITNAINLDKMASSIRVNDILKLANLENASGIFDMANINNLGDLSNLANNIDISNLTTALSSENIAKYLNIDSLNINNLTNKMYSGIASELEGLQNSLIESYKYAFNNLTDMATYDKLIGQLTGGISNEITNMLSGDFMSQLQSQIGKDLENILSGDMTSLLANEFSKQITGLNIDSITKLANINMDFETVKQLGTQLVDAESAVSALKAQSDTLANLANQATASLTGIDVSTFAALTAQLTGLDKVGTAVLNDAKTAADAINNISNLDKTVKEQLLQNINGLNNSVNELSNKIQKLDVATIEEYSNEIRNYQNNINNIIKVNNISSSALTNISKLGSSIEDIIKRAETLDIVTTQNVKHKLPEYTLGTLTELSTKLTGVTPNLNDLNSTIIQLSTNITNLNTAEIQNSINAINIVYEKMNSLKDIQDIDKKLLNAIGSQLKGVNSAINTVSQKIGLFNINTLNQIVANIENFDSKKAITLATQLSGLQNDTFTNLLTNINNIPGEISRRIQQTLKEKIAESVTQSISKNLSGKLSSNLMSGFASKGLPNSIVGGGNGEGPKEMGSVDQELESAQDEYITGFFVREIRKKDYFQTAEPILVPYNEAHWMDLFQKQKFVIVDDERGIDLNKLEDQAYINRYGKTIWEATGGQIEPLVYGYLQSIQTVDAEYILRFFKELFAEFPNVFRNQVTPSNNNTVKISKEALGWIFKTTEVQEIINTDTKETITVKKGEYEPVSWANSSVGILYSKKNNDVTGFNKDLEVVSPANGIVIKKEEKSKNQMGDTIPASIVIELQNTGDTNADGMRIIIKGAEFNVTVGDTVTKEQVIGKTTDHNIIITALSKGDHTQINNISEYIYPPYQARQTQKGGTTNETK